MDDPDVIILKSLLAARGKYISGNLLAKKVGISRVGIWARLEKLREQGYTFDAVRHRGYRISCEPEELNASLIRAYLALESSSTKIVFFPEIDSTNSEAERQLADGREVPFIIMASKQQVGRGRLGRKWHSPEEGNIYMSYVFRPQLPPARMQPFTLWMGLNICELLNRICELPVELKWPNDIVLKKKKVAGILTEARVDADQMRDLVFGLGLNVNSDCKQWPSEIASNATSLASEIGKPLQINHFAANLVIAGLKAYEQFCAGNYSADFFELWDRYNALKSKRVTVKTQTSSLSGKVEGIDEEGSLLLKDEHDKKHVLRAGEVSLGSAETLSCLSP